MDNFRFPTKAIFIRIHLAIWLPEMKKKIKHSALTQFFIHENSGEHCVNWLMSKYLFSRESYPLKSWKQFGWIAKSTFSHMDFHNVILITRLIIYLIAWISQQHISISVNLMEKRKKRDYNFGLKCLQKTRFSVTIWMHKEKA